MVNSKALPEHLWNVMAQTSVPYLIGTWILSQQSLFSENLLNGKNKQPLIQKQLGTLPPAFDVGLK
jgi:hypothetical protein